MRPNTTGAKNRKLRKMQLVGLKCKLFTMILVTDLSGNLGILLTKMANLSPTSKENHPYEWNIALTHLNWFKTLGQPKTFLELFQILTHLRWNRHYLNNNFAYRLQKSKLSFELIIKCVCLFQKWNRHTGDVYTVDRLVC